MTNPNTSATTSTFNLSGNLNLDSLLDEAHIKWGERSVQGLIYLLASLGLMVIWLPGTRL